MPTNYPNGSKFVVDLGQIKLPELVERQVEAEIQAIILKSLVSQGDAVRAKLPIENAWSKFFKNPIGTLGFIFNDPNTPIFPAATNTIESPYPLTPRDHNLVMDELMKHPFEVIKCMNIQDRSGQPDSAIVLAAALNAPSISADAKNIIRIALEILPKLASAKANAPKELAQAAENIRQAMDNLRHEDQIIMLRTVDFRGQPGLAEGCEFAAAMLEDGKDSIYSPSHSYYRLIEAVQPATTRARAVDNIKSADALGGTFGGGVGAFAAGIGAAPGAAVGALGGSAGYAIGTLINAIFG